jgi:hypothetical protein
MPFIYNIIVIMDNKNYQNVQYICELILKIFFKFYEMNKME